jgi:hypothetical protein
MIYSNSVVYAAYTVGASLSVMISHIFQSLSIIVFRIIVFRKDIVKNSGTGKAIQDWCRISALSAGLGSKD